MFVCAEVAPPYDDVLVVFVVLDADVEDVVEPGSVTPIRFAAAWATRLTVPSTMLLAAELTALAMEEFASE
jgi:hypothetical protein